MNARHRGMAGRSNGERESFDRERRARRQAVLIHDSVRERKAHQPEELIAAAHAGCFTMALSAELGKAGLVRRP